MNDTKIQVEQLEKSQLVWVHRVCNVDNRHCPLAGFSVIIPQTTAQQKPKPLILTDFNPQNNKLNGQVLATVFSTESRMRMMQLPGWVQEQSNNHLTLWVEDQQLTPSDPDRTRFIAELHHQPKMGDFLSHIWVKDQTPSHMTIKIGQEQFLHYNISESGCFLQLPSWIFIYEMYELLIQFDTPSKVREVFVVGGMLDMDLRRTMIQYHWKRYFDAS